MKPLKFHTYIYIQVYLTNIHKYFNHKGRFPRWSNPPLYTFLKLGSHIAEWDESRNSTKILISLLVRLSTSSGQLSCLLDSMYSEQYKAWLHMIHLGLGPHWLFLVQNLTLHPVPAAAVIMTCHLPDTLIAYTTQYESRQNVILIICVGVCIVFLSLLLDDAQVMDTIMNMYQVEYGHSPLCLCVSSCLLISFLNVWSFHHLDFLLLSLSSPSVEFFVSVFLPLAFLKDFVL